MEILAMANTNIVRGRRMPIIDVMGKNLLVVSTPKLQSKHGVGRGLFI